MNWRVAMKKIQSIKNIIFRATSVSLLAMLAACGGSSDEQQTDCTENFLILLICSVLSSDSPAPNQDPITAGVTISAGNSAGGSGVTAVVGQVDEYEPNNVLDNANIVTFPTAATGAPSGLEFKGSVQSIDDAADYFIFTPNRSGSLELQSACVPR